MTDSVVLTDPTVPGWILTLPSGFGEENNQVKITSPSGTHRFAHMVTDNGGQLVVPGSDSAIPSEWSDPAWTIYNNQF